MVDIAAISGMFSSIKAAKDIAESMIGLANAEATRGKVLEIQGKMLDAQNFAFAAQEERSALVERVCTLEKEVADLKAWGAEKETYELKTIDGGAFAYVKKKTVQTTEPPHWLCAACYQENQKRILQFDKQHERWHLYKCPRCSAQIRVGFTLRPGKERPEAIEPSPAS